MPLSAARSAAEFKRFLHNYAYTAAWWAYAEGLPSDENTITLDPERKDSRGLPVSRVTYEWGPNDSELSAAARDKAVEMMGASGARDVRVELRSACHGDLPHGARPAHFGGRRILPVPRH